MNFQVELNFYQREQYQQTSFQYQIQIQMKDQNESSTPKNINKNSPKQDKGFLLAKLLQKAVQNRREKKTKNQILNQSNVNSVQSKKTVKIEPQIFQNLKQTKQLNSKKIKNQPILKSKISNYQQHNFSFDDSLSIQPSFMTFQGEQVSQMLKFIYTQLFGEQKYFSDKKRYHDIQMNPDHYNIEQSQQFNKEGKMLENIIHQIKTIRLNLRNQSSEIKQLNCKNSQLINQFQRQKKIQFLLEQQKQKVKQKNKLEEKKMIQEKNDYQNFEQIKRQNQLLSIGIRQLQQQNYMLQQSIKKIEFEFEDYVKKTQKQNLVSEKKFEKIPELQQLLQFRDKQIDHLLSNIGYLQIQLNCIKQDILAKQRQTNQQNQNLTPLKKQNQQNQTEINRLSTIKQEEDIANITEFLQQNPIKIEKQIQTSPIPQRKDSIQSSNSFKKLDQNPSQLHRIIWQLKKIIAHKEKAILAYEKQIQTHETQVQKYQTFISQLSSQIDLCQAKLAQHSKKQEQMINKKIQTEQKYFSLLNEKNQILYNRQLTFGEREDNFLFKYEDQKQPSIAEQVDRNQNNLNIDLTFQQKNSRNKNHLPDVSEILGKQKYWDEISVTLSQFSETEQLRDIRNLTKQLSEAYDKIISLTYEVNNLKKTNSIKIIHQENQFKMQNIKMIKQK